jgi:hypothetical protein
MIKIVSDGKKLNKELEELETDYSKGNISKKEYFAHKRDIGQKMETLRVADHVRRMQGDWGRKDSWITGRTWKRKEKTAVDAEKRKCLDSILPIRILLRYSIFERECFGKGYDSVLALHCLAFMVGNSRAPWSS